MKVLKKFEFNDGANCLFLFLRNNGYTVSFCEEQEGNSCEEEFRISNINFN